MGKTGCLPRIARNPGLRGTQRTTRLTLPLPAHKVIREPVCEEHSAVILAIALGAEQADLDALLGKLAVAEAEQYRGMLPLQHCSRFASSFC
jgi:hypothetical protein